MTYAKWAMLAGVALALLALACEGSQRGENPAAPQTPERQAIGQALVIGINETGGPLPIIDPVSGVVIANVDSGYTPEVLLRRRSGQLLISQAFGSGPGEDEPSLTVFDLADPSTPLAIIPMPGRPSYKVYSPHGILSRNERYLYYARRTSICPNGGDTSVCDEWSIGVIDLTAGEQIAQAKVGLGCAPQFEGDSRFEDTVLVTCGKVAATSVQSTPDVVRLFIVSPDGETSELGTLSRRRTTNGAKSVLFAGLREDDTYFAVYNDGAVLYGGGEEVVADLLPEEEGEFGFNTGASLGNERYVLAFRMRFEHTFSGVMVLNATAPEDAQTFDLPFAVLHVAPLDERRVALLHGGGFEVSVLDVETGRVSDGMTLPERVEWLSGG